MHGPHSAGSGASKRARSAADAQLQPPDQLLSVLSPTTATFLSCVKQASPAWRKLYQKFCKDKRQRTALWILWLERTINLIQPSVKKKLYFLTKEILAAKETV